MQESGTTQEGEKFQHRYGIEETEMKGIFNFTKDGVQSQCPFVPPLIMAGKLHGQQQIVRLPCNTACPLAVVSESEDGNMVYTVRCGTGPWSYPLEGQPKNEGNRIILGPGISATGK